MKRVLIIGGNGCGKTTFAKELAYVLKLPLIHLDALYWRDHWTHAANEEFDLLLRKELVKPTWIMDGNMKRTLPVRLTYCDTVIFMDYPRRICVFGAIRRFFKNYGKSRPDMGGYCPERLSKESVGFIKSIWIHDKENRRQFCELLNQAGNVNKIVIKNRSQAKAFLRSLTA